MLIDKRLRSISPLWYARITKAKSLNGLLRRQDVDRHFKLYDREVTLDITKYHGCMVGEAFDFDDVYNESKQKDHVLNCKKCTSISQRVAHPIRNPNSYNAKKYFQRVVKEFCNHIEKIHGVNLSHGF